MGGTSRRVFWFPSAQRISRLFSVPIRLFAPPCCKRTDSTGRFHRLFRRSNPLGVPCSTPFAKRSQTCHCPHHSRSFLTASRSGANSKSVQNVGNLGLRLLDSAPFALHWRRTSLARQLVQSHGTLHGVDQLFRVITQAVLEDEFHVFEVLNFLAGISLDHHDVRLLPRLECPNP